MSLEVGGQAWSITVIGGAGVISPILPQTSSVRLVGVGDCHVYAAFDANPGGFYSIRFADDGSVSINEVEFMEAGPGLTSLTGACATVSPQPLARLATSMVRSAGAKNG
jgi:hypothetical protein